MSATDILRMLVQPILGFLVISLATGALARAKRLAAGSAAKDLREIRKEYGKLQQVAPDLPALGQLKARMEELAEAHAYRHLFKDYLFTTFMSVMLALPLAALSVVGMRAAIGKEAFDQWGAFVMILVWYSLLGLFIWLWSWDSARKRKRLRADREVFLATGIYPREVKPGSNKGTPSSTQPDSTNVLELPMRSADAVEPAQSPEEPAAS